MKTETKRRLRDGTSGVLSGMLPGSILADGIFDLLHKKAILEGKLKQFTLEDLLDEVVERSRFWSNCAVGERFQVPENNEISARMQIFGEGLSASDADLLLKEGRAFMDNCEKARRSYNKIKNVRPNETVIGEKAR